MYLGQARRGRGRRETVGTSKNTVEMERTFRVSNNKIYMEKTVKRARFRGEREEPLFWFSEMFFLGHFGIETLENTF